MSLAIAQLKRRKNRVRFKIRQKCFGRPRLCVFRSNNHTYAQVIDDVQQRTLVWASTLEKDISKALKSTSDCQAASLIGKTIAKRSLSQGIQSVVFDRGPFLFHGRVKTIAESAREEGLCF